eukprot:NODE_176_length_15869_cov_0.275777.p7 type:complete len:163 gc:universal NODE_176_length_15869_cov_0.275777:14077-14565(+)
MADFQSQQYERQYQYILDQLHDAFDKAYGYDKIETLINEAKEIQASCKMINHKLPSQLKQSFLSYESRYQEMSRKQTRNALLGNPVEDEKTSLLGTAEQGNMKLQNAHAVALDTEQVGIQTLQELKRQREQLQHTQQTVILFSLSYELQTLMLIERQAEYDK